MKEFEVLHKDGHTIPVEISPNVIEINGRKSLYGIFRDITSRKTSEQQLMVQKQKLEYIIEGTQLGTWEWHVQTGETVFNERWAEIIGYTLDELRPINIETWINNTHPDDLKKSNLLLQKHFNKELGYYKFEGRMKHKSGNWVWVLDRGKVIKWDESGKPLLMFGTHVDITEKKQAEIEKFENNQRLRSLFENNVDGIVVVDGNGKFLEANKSYCDMLGYTLEELGSMDNFLQITPKKWHKWEMEEKWDKKIVSNGYSGIYEKEYIRENGTIFPIEIQAFSIQDNAGKIKYVWGIVRDITERKKSEEALQESQKRYQDLVETSQDLIWQCDEKGRYIYLNPAWEDTLGYKLDEMLGKRFTDFQPQEYAERDMKLFFELLKGGLVKGYETIHLNKAGQKLHLVFNAVFVNDKQGNVIGTRGTAYNITDRFLAEEHIKKQLEEKEILLKEVHHRIKNNIMSIQGILRMQIRKTTNPESEKILRETLGRVESMRIIYDKLLITTSYKIISAKKYLEDLIKSIIDIFSNKDNVIIEMNIDDFKINSEIIFILGIITNELITNAVKHAFANKHGGLIEIHLKKKSNLIKLTIKDNGKGLPKDLDLDQQTSSFGFMIIKILIKQLGGDFDINIKDGTAFSLWFNID